MTIPPESKASSPRETVRPMFRWLPVAALPSLVLAMFCFLVVHGYLNAHGYRLGEISQLKTGALGLVGVLGIYALLSLFSRRVRSFNNILILNILLVLAGTEAILRVMQERLPFSIVEMLPNTDRERLLTQRGIFTVAGISGDGMLYSWKPNFELSSLPWVKVDANGYRNPEIPGRPDVVLLGDSVTIAQNSEQDMADVLRQRGLSALNLGFSGYGPFHQRDAYRKYVLDTGLEHRAVVINFCFCNDVTDAQSYEQLSRIGGDWRNYLGTTVSKNAFPFGFEPPWTVSILFNLPFTVVQNYRNAQNRIAAREELVLKLPRGEISATDWMLPRKARGLDDQDWSPALDALGDIMSLARTHGASVVLAYYPDLSQIYLPYFQESSPFRKAAQADYKDALARLGRLAKSQGAAFVDYTPGLQEGTGESRATSANSDYHPNDRGVAIMAETVLPILRSLLGTAANNN
ncbi:hypothetical protein JCM17960_13750 [Magnetospira thiophila]